MNSGMPNIRNQLQKSSTEALLSVQSQEILFYGDIGNLRLVSDIVDVLKQRTKTNAGQFPLTHLNGFDSTYCQLILLLPSKRIPIFLF